MLRLTRTPGWSASTRNIVAADPESPVRAMQMKNDAPVAPVMNHLCPSMRHPPFTGTAEVRSIDGSEPAPGAGSVIANAERISPAASGTR